MPDPLCVDETYYNYRSAAHFLEIFRTYYGPTLKAFAALDAAGQVDLAQDLTELLERFNQGGTDTLAVPSEYIEVATIDDGRWGVVHRPSSIVHRPSFIVSTLNTASEPSIRFPR